TQITIPLAIKAKFFPTNLSLAFFVSNFTILVNDKTDDCAFELKNLLPSYPAMGISFQAVGDRIKIDVENRLQNQSNFNGGTIYFMNGSEDRIVRCSISTFNFSFTNQTNRTYPVNFTVSSFNAPTMTALVNVFVPFQLVNETL